MKTGHGFARHLDGDVNDGGRHEVRGAVFPVRYMGFRAVLLVAVAIPALIADAGTLSPESEKRLSAAIASDQAEKRKLSKSAQKIEDGLRQEIMRSIGGKAASGTAATDAAEEQLCDCEIIAEVSDRLLQLVESVGGKIISKSAKYKSIHAVLPYNAIESLSEDNDVKSIRRVVPRMLNKVDVSDGVAGHNVTQARDTYGVSGAGVKVGVISDSARYLSEMQSTGDLPSDVTILNGFEGMTYDKDGNRSDTGEGSGMMEIVYDVAPDAKLFFATGFGTDPEFAEVIETFYENGCRVVVDDVGWPTDPAFLDGVVSQAINDFTSKGGVYFSSASNSGNKDSGTSGTWEGDFSDSGGTFGSYGGSKHSFSSSATANEITRTASGITLQWADSWDSPDSDYDLYVADANGAILAKSCNGQGTNYQNPPYEYISIASQIGENFCYTNRPGLYVVVVKCSGTDRFLRIDTARGRLAISTDGSTSGHNAAAAAITCAAASAPYPQRAFTATDPIETYSSDGPRKIFFDKNGAAITAGNFLSSGGRTLQKPDVTAADDTFSYWCRLHYNEATFTGTSAAAPHAAAIAALMLEANPSLDRDGVFEIMKQATFSGSSASWNRTSGYGILNAEECVRLAKASATAEEKTIDIPADRTYGTCTLVNDGSSWKTTAAFPEWVKSLSWVSETGNMGPLAYNVWTGFSGTVTLTANCTTNDTGSARHCDISITNKQTKAIQYVLHINQAPYVAPVVRPANDNYANATSLGSAAYGNVSGSNANATRETGEPYVYVSSSTSQGTNTVWWAWTAPTAGVAVFDTAGSGFDTVMAAYAKASLVSALGDKLDSNDDDTAQGSSYRQSKIAFDTAGGSAYRIVVAGYGSNSGTIALNWQQYVKVTFNGNGATSGSMPVATNAYNTATALPSCGFQKTGYDFSGWATSVSGSVSYDDGASPKFTSNTTLYAVWTQKEETMPSKPTISASGTECGVTVAWSAFWTDGNEAPAKGYEIWRAESASGSKTRLDCEIDVSLSYILGTYSGYYSATDKTGTPGKDYWYWLAATNSPTAKTFSDPKSAYRRVGLSLSTNAVSFASGSDSDNVGITANTSWTATKTQDWLSLATASGSGNGTLLFSATANAESSPRSDTITVTAGGSTAHPVSQTITITQDAKPQTFTVTFNANGGTGPDTTQEFSPNVAQNLASCAFSRSSYHFLGWSEDPDAREPSYADGALFTATADTTLYAVWRSNKHAVEFDANGGTGTMKAQTFTWNVAKALSACAFTREHYSFDGWATNAIGPAVYADGESIQIDDDLILYAIWEPQTYAITFNGNGATSGTMAVQSFTYGVQQDLSANAFQKTGHIFKGWATTQGGAVAYANGAAYSATASVTLYAVWEPQTYTITFNGNGATSGTMATQSFTYGISQNLRANAFQKTGHDFKGWATTQGGTVAYANGASYSATANATLYAVWEPKTYTVTFNGNGATSGTMAAQSFAYGVSQNLRANAFQKTDHDFKGWATTQGGAVAYANGASYSATANATLYAVWEPKTYTVTFNGNGATFGTMAAQSFTYGVSQNLRANAFQKTGHDFKGWATTLGGAVAYADGASYSAAANATLYAVWEPQTFTVRFLSNDGTDTVLATRQFSYGVEAPLNAPTPDREGYSLVGWATTSRGPVEYIGDEMAAFESDTDLYAVWSAGLGGALEGSPLVWTTGGDAPWFGVSLDGEDVARSGTIGDDESSWIGTEVTGPGRMTFRWKVSSETYRDYQIDYLAFYIDDEEMDWIGGEVDWESCSFDVGEGVHSLTWTYFKDEIDFDGEDCAWLDDVFFLHRSGITFVAAEATSGTAPDAIGGWENDEVILPEPGTLRRAKHDFAGWTDGTNVYSAGSTFELRASPVTLSAAWTAKVVATPVIEAGETYLGEVEEIAIRCATEGATIRYTTDGSDPKGETAIVYDWSFVIRGPVTVIRAVATLDDWFDSEEAVARSIRQWTASEVLDAPDRFFDLRSDNPWTHDIVTNHDGVASMRSGAIGNDEESRLSTMVYGPGTASFWWKVSSEMFKNRKIDYLSFLADGEEKLWIGGEKDWERATVRIEGEGAHSLAWVYSKDSEGSTGDDCGWLDEFIWTPDGGDFVSVETENGEAVAIDRFWIVENVSGGESDPVAAANGTAANGKPIWQAYIAGYDPNDPDADFRATIRFENGCPVIEPDPDHRDTRTYDIDGKPTLDAEWGEPNENSRFFRVRVHAPAAQGSTGGEGNIGILAAPSGVSATNDRDDGVLVAWEAVPGATTYEIWKGSVGDADPSRLVSSVASSSGLDPDAMAGIQSRYWVRAVSGTGASPLSIPVDGMKRLPAPTGVTAASSSNPVALTWNEVTGATMYEVWRSESDAVSSATRIATVIGSSYSDGSSTHGHQYWYWVRALRGDATGAFSDSAIGHRLLDRAIGVSCSQGTDSSGIRIQWEPVDGAVSYNVFRNSTSDGNYTKIGTTTSTSYFDSNPGVGNVWYYIVKGDGQDVGAVGYSAWASGYQGISPPTSVSATQGDSFSEITVSWAEVPGAIAYDIWRGTTTSSSEASLLRSGATSPYRDTTTDVGQNYYYWVRARSQPGAVSNFGNWALGRNADVSSLVINGATSLAGIGAQGWYGVMAKSQSGKILALPSSVTPTWTFTDSSGKARMSSASVPSGMSSTELGFGSGSRFQTVIVTNNPTQMQSLLSTLKGTISVSCDWRGNTVSASKTITVKAPVTSDPYASYYAGTNSAVVLGSYTGTVASVSVPSTFNGGAVLGLNRTFDGNKTVTSVSLPDSLLSIGDYAFRNCDKIASITIPASAKSIGSSVFSGDTSLKTISVATGNERYSSLSGMLYDKTTKTLLVCPSGKTGAVTISSGVEKLDSAAFSGCSAITSISCPASLVTIPGASFNGCASLKSITVNSSNPNYNNTTGYGADGILFDKTFTTLVRYPPAKAETALTIPDSVVTIGQYAFEGASKLTHLSVPGNVSNCGAGFISGCTNLLYVYFFGDQPTTSYIDGRSRTLKATAYYLSGTSGWGSSFGRRAIASIVMNCGLPTSEWDNPIQSLSISGPDNVASGGTGKFVGKGSFQSGHLNYACKVTWSITSGSSYASISEDGTLTANETTISRSVTIKATATLGGATKTATKTVTISP